MVNPIRLTIEQDSNPSAVKSGMADDEIRTPHRVSAFDLVSAQPWAITPAMLEIIGAIARRENDAPEAVEARIGRPLQNARKVTLRGNVAVVPVTGPVFRYANLMTEISGATSLEVLAKDFTAALDDPAVSSIVLNIDSPGGQAAGISEFASMVRGAKKTVVAYIDGSGASAAYWIAAAASEIVVSKTGEVGSIGAVVAIDPARAKTGMVEIVSSQSPKKRPDITTDEGRSQIQSRIDQLAQVFVEDVAAYRGVSVETVLAKFGQGDMRMGAEAVAIGMADRVATLEEVIAGLAGANQTKPEPKTYLKGTAMNLEELRAAHPDLCAALLEEGRTVGATAERQRIFDVEAQALPGHDALIAQFKVDGTTTGPMAAIAVLNAERAITAGRASKLAADAPQPVAHASAPEDKSAAEDKTLPIEERAKAKWDGDAAIRAEFGKFETFLAFAKAHDAGTVKVLSK
jgi:ClpP class serine protease